MSFVKISDLEVITANELNGLEDVLVTKHESSKKLSLAELSTFVISDVVSDISDVVSDINNINNTLESKVDKEPNKGLSTEDFTTEEKNKLQTLQNYTLPVATNITLGGVKLDSDNNELQINIDGILSINDVNWSKISSTPSTIIGYGITDAYNKTEVDNKIQLKANIISPQFIGIPKAPTASIGTNNTQIATTEFVNAEIQNDSTDANIINTIVRRDNSGNFSANDITANLIGNSSTSNQLNTDRIFTLSGDVSGSISSNLSNGFNIVTTVADNSHNHTISNITDLQTELNSKINVSEKASANGVATLDGNSKINLNQIPDSILGQLEYMGVHDFSSELPIATEKGQYWIVSIGGNDYEIGDWAVWNGISFDKVDNTDAVSSVAGRTGNVLLTKDDVDLDNVENTADNTKNVLSATKWTTPRTITLSGDVAGSASVDGSANVTITTAVQPNSVNLGTDTTGNYVAGVTAGTGISISGTAGEGWSPTITNTAPNVTTNITTTHNATNVVVNSSDGTNGTINSATQTLAGVMTAADKSKLDGIATGATANVGTVTSIATSGAITGGTVTSTGTISHSTADGYLHVPATGTTNNGKVLTAGATAGSLSWTAIPSAPVTSVAGKTGAVTLVKGDVGLGSVDNTADSTKNVLSATKLTTVRTIGGVSFDGTANINLPGVNTIGNQSTTGNAATATKLALIGGTYSGEYSILANTTSGIYAHPGITHNGTTNTLKLANVSATESVKLGSTQQASVQYNSTDNSIDFIIN